MANVSVTLRTDADVREVLDGIRSEVDKIDLPEDAEDPVVVELTLKRHVIHVAVAGDAPEQTLKAIAEEVRDEACRSKETLQERLGIGVTTFAYPYGTRAAYSELTGTILRECGYQTAFTTQHGAVLPGSEAIELPRIKVEGGDPLWMFRKLCQGGIDGWRYADRFLWRLQKSPAR